MADAHSPRESKGSHPKPLHTETNDPQDWTASTGEPSPLDVLQMQRTIGNRATQRLLGQARHLPVGGSRAAASTNTAASLTAAPERKIQRKIHILNQTPIADPQSAMDVAEIEEIAQLLRVEFKDAGDIVDFYNPDIKFQPNITEYLTGHGTSTALDKKNASEIAERISQKISDEHKAEKFTLKIYSCDVGKSVPTGVALMPSISQAVVRLLHEKYRLSNVEIIAPTGKLHKTKRKEMVLKDYNYDTGRREEVEAKFDALLHDALLPKLTGILDGIKMLADPRIAMLSQIDTNVKEAVTKFANPEAYKEAFYKQIISVIYTPIDKYPKLRVLVGAIVGANPQNLKKLSEITPDEFSKLVGLVKHEEVDTKFALRLNEPLEAMKGSEAEKIQPLIQTVLQRTKDASYFRKLLKQFGLSDDYVQLLKKYAPQFWDEKAAVIEKGANLAVAEGKEWKTFASDD